MLLNKSHTTNLSNSLLKCFANEVLKAHRLSNGYLQALRVILGNMSLADRLGVSLRFSIDVPFASKSTMRTIIDQLVKAGFTYDKIDWTDNGYRHRSRNYKGRLEVLPDDVGQRLTPTQIYSILQRGQEQVDATRNFYSLGIYESDCPY